MAFQTEAITLTDEECRQISEHPGAFDIAAANLSPDLTQLSSLFTFPSGWRVTKLWAGRTTAVLPNSGIIGLTNQNTTPSASAPGYCTIAAGTGVGGQHLNVDGLFHDPDDLYLYANAALSDISVAVWIKPADGRG